MNLTQLSFNTSGQQWQLLQMGNSTPQAVTQLFLNVTQQSDGHIASDMKFTANRPFTASASSSQRAQGITQAPSSCSSYDVLISKLVQAVKSGDLIAFSMLDPDNRYLNIKDEDMWSLTHWAAVCGQDDILRYLIRNGVNPNALDRFGNTPLHYAIEQGQNECALTLVGAKICNLETINHKGLTPLQQSIIQGNRLLTARLLDSGVRCNLFYDKTKLSLGHLAVMSNQLEMIEILMKRGISLQQRDIDGLTPYQFAAFINATDMMHRLAHYGLQEDLHPVLHLVVRHNKLDSLKTMCTMQKLNLEYRDGKGNTPLLVAAKHNFRDVVKFLIERGADFRTSNFVGQDVEFFLGRYGCSLNDLFGQSRGNVASSAVGVEPLRGREPSLHSHSHAHAHSHSSHSRRDDFSRVNSQESHTYPVLNAEMPIAPPQQPMIAEGDVIAAVRKNSLDFFESLVKNRQIDALMRVRDVKGFNVLQMAVQWSKLAIFHYLMKNGATRRDLDVMDKQNWTIAHSAARNGFLEVLQVLKTHGINLDRQNVQGRTPLHLAAQLGHRDVVQFLIEQKADLSLSTFNLHWTPLHCAVAEGHKDIAVRLLRAGADGNLQTEHGETAAHFAVNLEDSSILKSLLTFDVNCFLSDKKGMTPLAIAVAKGRDDMVKLLESRAARDSNSNRISTNEPIPSYSGSVPPAALESVPANGVDFNSPNTSIERVSQVASSHFGEEETKERSTSTAPRPLYIPQPATILGNESLFAHQFTSSLSVDNASELPQRGGMSYRDKIEAAEKSEAQQKLAVQKATLTVTATLPTIDSEETQKKISAQRPRKKGSSSSVAGKKNASIKKAPNENTSKPKQAISEEACTAARLGDLEKIQQLAEAQQLRGVDKKGNTVAHWAAIGGKVNVLHCLMNYNINLKGVNFDGETIGHIAARRDHRQVLDFYLSLADKEARDNHGNTLLLIAARHGKKDAVEYLTRKGADVHAKDSRGRDANALYQEFLKRKGSKRA